MTPLCAVLMPEEADVESEVSELFVLLSPLDSEAIELFADDRPVDAEVESEVRPLFVDDSPVDSDEIELLNVDMLLDSEPMPVDAEVDSE
ncbi:putative chromosome segregation ATPase [Burkholderia pseudomallei TSV44]|nr:putative chromosome segregation ATPase [Burkholderia pseudomallei TSV44]